MNLNNYGFILGGAALQLLLGVVAVVFFLFILFFIFVLISIAVLRLQGYHWDSVLGEFTRPIKKKAKNGKNNN